MSSLKWFYIRFKDGSYTVIQEYDMATAMLAADDETGSGLRCIEEVANGFGDKL